MIKPQTDLEELTAKAERDFIPLGVIVHEPWFENQTEAEVQEQIDLFKKTCGL